MNQRRRNSKRATKKPIGPRGIIQALKPTKQRPSDPYEKRQMGYYASSFNSQLHPNKFKKRQKKPKEKQKGAPYLSLCIENVDLLRICHKILVKIFRVFSGEKKETDTQLCCKIKKIALSSELSQAISKLATGIQAMKLEIAKIKTNVNQAPQASNSFKKIVKEQKDDPKPPPGLKKVDSSPIKPRMITPKRLHLDSSAKCIKRRSLQSQREKEDLEFNNLRFMNSNKSSLSSQKYRENLLLKKGYSQRVGGGQRRFAKLGASAGKRERSRILERPSKSVQLRMRGQGVVDSSLTFLSRNVNRSGSKGSRRCQQGYQSLVFESRGKGNESEYFLGRGLENIVPLNGRKANENQEKEEYYGPWEKAVGDNSGFSGKNEKLKCGDSGVQDEVNRSKKELKKARETRNNIKKILLKKLKIKKKLQAIKCASNKENDQPGLKPVKPLKHSHRPSKSSSTAVINLSPNREHHSLSRRGGSIQRQSLSMQIQQGFPDKPQEQPSQVLKPLPTSQATSSPNERKFSDNSGTKLTPMIGLSPGQDVNSESNQERKSLRESKEHPNLITFYNSKMSAETRNESRSNKKNNSNNTHTKTNDSNNIHSEKRSKQREIQNSRRQNFSTPQLKNLPDCAALIQKPSPSPLGLQPIARNGPGKNHLKKHENQYYSFKNLNFFVPSLKDLNNVQKSHVLRAVENQKASHDFKNQFISQKINSNSRSIFKNWWDAKSRPDAAREFKSPKSSLVKFRRSKSDPNLERQRLKVENYFQSLSKAKQRHAGSGGKEGRVQEPGEANFCRKNWFNSRNPLQEKISEFHCKSITEEENAGPPNTTRTLMGGRGPGKPRNQSQSKKTFKLMMKLDLKQELLKSVRGAAQNNLLSSRTRKTNLKLEQEKEQIHRENDLEVTEDYKQSTGRADLGGGIIFTDRSRSREMFFETKPIDFSVSMASTSQLSAAYRTSQLSTKRLLSKLKHSQNEEQSKKEEEIDSPRKKNKGYSLFKRKRIGRSLASDNLIKKLRYGYWNNPGLSSSKRTESCSVLANFSESELLAKLDAQKAKITQNSSYLMQGASTERNQVAENSDEQVRKESERCVKRVDGRKARGAGGGRNGRKSSFSKAMHKYSDRISHFLTQATVTARERKSRIFDNQVRNLSIIKSSERGNHHQEQILLPKNRMVPKGANWP